MSDLQASAHDNFPLLHLLDLVSREPIQPDVSQSPKTEQPDACAVNRRLHPNDATTLETLKTEDVQSWCLSRIAEYRAPITTVRAKPDFALYNASLHEFVVRHKSHIWALRSAYNDAALLHRYLPPEILLQIFAHLPHDGTREGSPALQVCRYWHTLLQRTPQLWQTFVSREFVVNEDSPWKTKRFAEALSRSAPLDLSLRLRSIDHAIVDALAPYSRRFTSVTLIPLRRSHEFDPLYRFLQLEMPMLRCLDICRWFYRKAASLFAPYFFMFPHLQTLGLDNMHLGPPEALLPMLRHLKLTNCWEFVPPTNPSSRVNAVPMTLQALLTIVRNSPNLETLLVKGTYPRGMPWPDPDCSVDVPRLRHLTLEFDPPEVMPVFISHLILPLTTALNIVADVSSLNDQISLYSGEVVPLGEASPLAEVSMDIRPSSIANSATWETEGYASRSRPLRVSISHHNNIDHPYTILGRTNNFLAIFAPGTAVTSLRIVSGRYLRSEDFWTELLGSLPHLTHLTVDPGRAGDYPRVLPLLGKLQGYGGCLCPILTDLSLLWDPSNETWAESVLKEPQATLMSARVPPGSGPWTVAASTQEYCRVLQQCLCSRADHGCLPLRAMSVSIWDRRYGTAVEAGLREGLEGLKDLVEEISVGQSKQRR